MEINDAEIEEVFFLPVNLFIDGRASVFQFNLNINIPFKADALQINNIGAVTADGNTMNYCSFRSNLPLKDYGADLFIISTGGLGLPFNERVKNFDPLNQVFLLDNTQFIDGTYNFRGYDITNGNGNFWLRLVFTMKFMKFKSKE